MTSRCFGWAGFQMLRVAQHDSSMSDFAGLWLGGILDASRGGVAPLRLYDMVGRDFRCFAALSITIAPGYERACR